MTPSPALSLGPAEAPPAWLADIARSIRSALDAGAVRVADPAGHLVLVRPCGRHFTAAAHIVEQLAQAGLLPPLPETLGEPGVDDPVDRAERAAIQAEPALPPEGSPERAEADRRQADEIAALLTAALCRPPGWSDVGSAPAPGAWCSCCGRQRRRGGRWWCEAQAPTGWRCATCHPPDHLPPGERVEARS